MEVLIPSAPVCALGQLPLISKGSLCPHPSRQSRATFPAGEGLGFLSLCQHAVPVDFQHGDGADFVVQVFTSGVDLDIVGGVTGVEFPLPLLK